MPITIEMIMFFLGVLGAIFTGMSFIVKRIDRLGEKIEQLQQSIGKVERDYVTHEVCSRRQDKCPCVREMEELKKILEIGVKKT